MGYPVGVSHILVPATGIEPVRVLRRGILSPLCLPIPPCRRIVCVFVSTYSSCCGARHLRRRRCDFLICRPRPLAQVALSATGGASFAPHAGLQRRYSSIFLIARQGEPREDFNEAVITAEIDPVRLHFGTSCGKILLRKVQTGRYAPWQQLF